MKRMQKESTEIVEKRKIEANKVIDTDSLGKTFLIFVLCNHQGVVLNYSCRTHNMM